MKEINTVEGAWIGCLELWFVLSKTPETNGWDLKRRVLELLGYECYDEDCPFCEIHEKERGVCPLTEPEGVCNIQCSKKTPFKDWIKALINIDTHKPELADAFYRYLLQLYEETHKKKWTPTENARRVAEEMRGCKQ